MNAMEDPVGFLHYPRADASKELAGARVRHWHEYEQLMPNAQAEVQARRCMDCGTPHCHRYCPVHNLIPDWNALVNEQDWRVAYEQLEQTNNFPEFTGRLCSAPCEDACTLSIGSRPVTIVTRKEIQAGRRRGIGACRAGLCTAAGARGLPRHGL